MKRTSFIPQKDWGIKLYYKLQGINNNLKYRSPDTAFSAQGNAVFFCSTKKLQFIHPSPLVYRLHIYLSLSTSAKKQACFFYACRILHKSVALVHCRSPPSEILNLKLIKIQNFGGQPCQKRIFIYILAENPSK